MRGRAAALEGTWLASTPVMHPTTEFPRTIGDAWRILAAMSASLGARFGARSSDYVQKDMCEGRRARGAALVWAALAAGCARPGGGGGGGSGAGVLPDGATAAPRVAGVSVRVEEVRLSTAPASRYGTPVQHALLAAEEELGRAMGGQGLRHDPGLSRAARELARTAPSRTNVPGGLIAGVTAWASLFDPPPRLAISELPAEGAPCGEAVSPSCKDALASLASAARGSLSGAAGVWYGVGVATLPSGDVRLVVAMTERGVAIDPLPSALPEGGRTQIRGRLLGRRGSPSFEVIGPDGRYSPIPAKVTRGEFVGEFTCGRRGAYQVEVLAEGAYGPEVVANFPIHCGEAPPRALRIEVEQVGPEVTAEDVARANFAALNDARARQGLPLLQWDNQAAAIAAGHSQDMLRSGFVGHTSPTTGDVDARFQRAGLKSAVIRENVARGYGPWAIHHGLMASPGHRINILSPDVTHVGIGAVFGPPESSAPEAPRPILLTQNYYAKLGADAPTSDLPGALRRRVDALREGKGLRPIAWHRGLSEAAQAYAEGIAGGTEGRAAERYQAMIGALGFPAVETHRVVAPSFASLDGFRLWAEAAPGTLGVGVAKVAKGKEAGSLIAIVSVGTR